MLQHIYYEARGKIRNMVRATAPREYHIVGSPRTILKQAVHSLGRLILIQLHIEYRKRISSAAMPMLRVY